MVKVTVVVQYFCSNLLKNSQLALEAEVELDGCRISVCWPVGSFLLPAHLPRRSLLPTRTSQSSGRT